ncbi:efflux transporter outer membrane subunit [uncultured Hymenobacter sp.]|uniref:efflux transporter outer membrane subunit n=1 Tax=uncultured Hymenobacter sp. TaxID=170016 RepID=UPI0035C9E8AF
MRNFKVRALVGLLLLCGLTSCHITRPGGAPAASLAGLYRDQVATDTVTLAQLPWRTLFTDPALQTLIAQGITHNLDLQVAGARVREADAYFRQSQAAFLPSLSATGSVARSRQAGSSELGTLRATTFYQLYGSASWEADVWGKLRNSRRSYLALLLQSEAYRRAVQTSVVAGIANYYYQLLALDQQLAITRQTVQNRIQDVETSRKLSAAGIVTGAAVVQSEAIRYAAEVTIPDLKQQIRETENALSRLLGVAPAAIGRGTLAAQQPVTTLSTGVPAQLLRFRPDVQQAEYAFRSAFALTNAARAYFYPALTLTASGGYSAFDFSQLLDPTAVFGSLAGGLVQPLLTRGVNRARLRVSEAQQLEAQLNFQTALLTAGQEVSDALYSYQAAEEKITIRARQLDALQKSVTYSQALLANGFANYTEVLTAQQNLLTAQLNGVSDQQQRLQAVTNLYRALGGGWQ